MSVPYIAGDGALRQRKSASGDGTTADPDVFSFSDQGTYDRVGEVGDAPIAAPTTSGTLAGVIRGFWRDMLSQIFIESQTPSAVTVATALTTLITFDCRGKSTLGVQLQNTGAVALSGLQVQARFNSSLSIWNAIASTTADFTTNNGETANNASTEIISSGGTIVTIPASGNAWFRMHCEGIESVRIQAQVASGNTTMLAHGIVES